MASKRIVQPRPKSWVLYDNDYKPLSAYKTKTEAYKEYDKHLLAMFVKDYYFVTDSQALLLSYAEAKLVEVMLSEANRRKEK